MRRTVHIYVDGSALGNENADAPSRGGVAAVAFDGEKELMKWRLGRDEVLKIVERYDTRVTNNTTELLALDLAYNMAYKISGGIYNCDYDFIHHVVRGDSQYAGNLIHDDWKAKKNKKLVEMVKETFSSVSHNLGDYEYTLTWEYVKAHASDDRNNYVDYVARTGAHMIPEHEVLNYADWKRIQPQI